MSLIAPSSWSCVHGVERWRSDCACRIAPAPAGRPMHWRAPLRQALDWLATELHGLYEWEGGALMVDHWAARDGYGERRWDPAAARRFVAERLRSPDSGGGRVRACELLEIEWDALAMFTSCGWFFDDVSGIETLQVLHYAARAIELAGKEAPRLEAGLLDRLAQAESAHAEVGTGRDLYVAKVKPKYPTALRVAAGAAAARQLAVPIPTSGVALVREEAGWIIVTHGRTGREESFRAAVHKDGAAGVAIELPPALRLDLDDLPERYRIPITASLRADVIEHRFTPEERVQLAAGAVDAPTLAARALGRAVRTLASDHSADAVAAVFELADLLDLYGLQVPFDAQTACYRIRSTVSPDVAQALTPVATRLGFTAEG